EVAGITARDGAGPHIRPSVAWVRSRADAAGLVIGGRHLGAAADAPLDLRIAIAGQPFTSLAVAPGFFDRVVPIPPMTLQSTDAYVPLAVSSAARGGGRSAPVALEQFDLQPRGVPMLAFEDGWQEPEYDRRTARAWRWMTEQATLWVRPIGRD